MTTPSNTIEELVWRVARVVRRIFHRHRFDQIIGTMEPCGVTLGWDFRLTTEYSILERCTCGAEHRTKGWVLPRRVEEMQPDRLTRSLRIKGDHNDEA